MPTSRASAGVSRALRRWSLGIRGKLLLVLCVFLAIPWLGYAYVRELESFLREAQERTLAGTAQAVATALHDRPALFARGTGADAVPPPDGTPSPAPEIDEILQALSRTTARIFVVDAKGQVLARAGSLKRPAGDDAGKARGLAVVGTWIERYTLRPLYALLLRQPTEDFSDDFLGRPLPFAKEVDGALAGILTTDRRPSRDGRVTIVTAAHPIWVGDRVQGAVVVEETTNVLLAERNRAFGRLFTLVLGVTLVGALALTVFATRLSSRIRRLRDEIEHAIDAKGRVRHIVAGSQARDEIGDLSRSFSSVLGRLADSARHREELASRLSHELRTPIAVVRSSLETLQGPVAPDDARVYLDRAQGGLDRLAQILTRMSEATRLEQSIDRAEFERFDLVALARGCVDGYRMAYAPRAFILDAAAAAIEIDGAPDLAAQMLDKLCANAVEFGMPDRPIVVRVERAGGAAVVSVSNDGPLLPEGMAERIFESMVSLRDEGRRGGAGPHLGLGLYIVRLIVEAHGGTVRADNRADGSGVVVTVTLPLSRPEAR
ncbi:MAG TPA: ATP-binding protein [Casimicrobiaceae bacterium]|nr:ATP-binding protein [Casimicrobiaceae bacterium]